jgi:nucleotide-binding universal stress UspA family protein
MHHIFDLNQATAPMEKKLTKILIACNHHPSTQSAIALGAYLSRRCGTELHLLLNNNSPGQEQVLEAVRKQGVGNPVFHNCTGKGLKELLHCQKEIQADLLVTGTEPEGQIGFLQKSHAFRLASMQDTPVLAVPEMQETPALHRLLVHLDSSPETRQTLGITAALAKACNAQVAVTGASSEKDPESEHHLDVFCNHALRYFTEHGIKASCSSNIRVKPAAFIQEQAATQRANIVSMMTETETVGLLSTPDAEQLIRSHSVPVLLMRPREMRVAGGGL